MMEYRKLGASDLLVSRVCVGCMSFGERFEDFHMWTLNQKESDAMVERALELGINFFDTANQYAHGTSEIFLGSALRRMAKREDVVIASKVYFNEGHLKKEAIFREIEGTLSRLRTDYLDLYIIHRYDKDTPYEETMEALDTLVRQGKVRALGASAMFGYQFANYQQAAKDNGFTPFVSMQNHYNLLYREDERELIPICRQQGVALTPYSPLAGGHLAKRVWAGETERARTDRVLHAKYEAEKENDMQILERVVELADKRGVKVSQIALAWLLKKDVATLLVGATKPEYLNDAAEALKINLTDEETAYLEEPYRAHEIVGANR